MKTLICIIFLFPLIIFSQTKTKLSFNDSLMINMCIEAHNKLNYDSLSLVTINKINNYRKENDLNILIVDTTMNNYCENWSKICIKSKYNIKHSDLSKTDYKGENIHLKFGSLGAYILGKKLFERIPDEILFGWQNSEGHNRNLLKNGVTKIGLHFSTFYDGYEYRLVAVMVIK
jgi:uncharacterized protein YkwD